MLAGGLCIWIALEAFINMSVMLNLLPFAGNALPFISAGGSNLGVTLAAVGILLNISRLSVQKREEQGKQYNAIVDMRWRDRRGVYPALAVLQEMMNNLSGVLATEQHPENATCDTAKKRNQVLWVGSKGGMEKELVERTGIPFKSISAAGLHGVGWRALPENMQQMIRGYRQAKDILDEFKPDAMVFTGGYIAAPMALAGRKIHHCFSCQISNRAWR